MEFFLQLIVAGIVVGSIYAIVALGFTLIYKSTGVVNFAQGELLLIGAYICLHITVEYQLNFIVSFIVTVLFMFFFGFFIEKIFLRKMIGEPIIFFKKSKIGIAMRTVASDQQAALSMGIDVKRIFALSWAIAAVVSSIGGILIGNINGINTSLSQFGLKVFPVVILGA